MVFEYLVFFGSIYFFCPALRCPDLSNPTGGAVRYEGVVLGSRAQYRCNDGFVLVGGVVRTCRRDGTWSGEAPVCQSGRIPIDMWIILILGGTPITEVCTVELDGEIEVERNSATYSFRGVGSSITGYICKLDGIVLPNCMLQTSILDLFLTCLLLRLQSSDWSSFRAASTEDCPSGMQSQPRSDLPFRSLKAHQFINSL